MMMEDKDTFFEVDLSKPESCGCNGLSEEDRLSLECTICGNKRDLVRDHNHNTGFIRGILCDRCNRRLGTYCKKMCGSLEVTKESYKEWAKKYKKRIEIFIDGDVGIKYHGFRGEVLLEKMRRRGVQLNGTRYEDSDIDTSVNVEVDNNFVKIML